MGKDVEEKLSSRRSCASSQSSSASSRRFLATTVSRKSFKSGKSDASVYSIQNRALIAGLMAEIECVQDRYNAKLENEIRRLKQQKETELQSKLLELDNEIKVTKAKQTVFDGEDNQYSNIIIRQRNQQDATVKRTAFG